MHPTYTSDKPGDCPICNMRLVPMEKPEGAPRKTKTVWRSSMNPNEVHDRPGKDSMGMDLVPVEVEETEQAVPGFATVTLTPQRRQAIGVKTAVVESGPFVRTIRAVGRVAVDETRLHHVHAKFEGWIEHLHADFTGREVKKGEPLFTVYSPEVLAPQQEVQIALRTARRLETSSLPDVAAGGRALVESARRRLLLWDLSPDVARRLEAGGEPQRAVTLHAPASGTILEKKALPGMRVMPGEEMFTIADLSTVWILADVYDHELPFVHVGQEVDVTMSYFPGERRRGVVTFLYPTLDEQTRTARVRVELPNPGGALRPDMYGNVEIEVDLGQRLRVPDTALLHTGQREVAFVDLGEGRLEPREVKVGLRIRDWCEVLEGLIEGERVVTSANFLVDSESQLKAALSAMGGP
jgi:RND family efflux transporter MFP subunit